MAEWSNAAVLKTVVPRGTGGSNPSSSASLGRVKPLGFTLFVEYRARNLFQAPCIQQKGRAER